MRGGFLATQRRRGSGSFPGGISRTKQLLTTLGVSFVEHGALWLGATAREKDLLVEWARALASAKGSAKESECSKVDTTPLRIGGIAFEASLREPAFTFDRLSFEKALEKHLAKDGIVSAKAGAIVSVDRAGLFEYHVRFRDVSSHSSGAIRETSASIILLVSDLLPPPLFPSFADKWLQVTLGSFSFRRKTGPSSPSPFSMEVPISLFPKVPCSGWVFSQYRRRQGGQESTPSRIPHPQGR